MPALGKLKLVAERVVCETNMKGLSTAMMVYANDYNDALPTGDEWCDLLIQEADVSSISFRCPSAPEGTCTYALNKNLVTLDVSATTVVMFECPPGWNQVGGPELLTTEYHQGEGCNIAFADGTVEFVEAAMLEQLDWGEKSNE
jgi:prepilin-type processing-associated H-X9-DG protein